MNGTVTLGAWHPVYDGAGVRLGAVAEGPAGTWTAAARLADAKAAVVAQMHADGMSYAQIAAVTGMKRARVQQLAERGRALAPSGEFDLLVRP
jgi:hypothetical protein